MSQPDRTPNAATKLEYRLRREFLGASGIYGTDYVPLYGNPSRESAFATARDHLKHAKRVIVESREATPWTKEGTVGDA